MKNIFTLLLLSSQILTAQIQIENGNFETWDNSGSDEQEPQQWSSLKTSDDDSWLNLANQAPQVIWKETSNPHTGSACLKLKVASYNALVGLAPNAIVTNGRVFASTTPSDGYVYTDESNSQWNTACNDKPDSLIGWYKYAPQNGDKGKVEIMFHTSAAQGKLPESGGTSHWVGNGIIEFTTAKSNWTRFSFPISFYTVFAPNYFLTVATAGDGLNAEAGSQLWLDDMSFIYNPPVSVEEIEVSNFNISAYNSQIDIDINSTFIQAELTIFTLDGKIVLNESINSENSLINSDLSNGIYIYQLSIDGEVSSGKIVL